MSCVLSLLILTIWKVGNNITILRMRKLRLRDAKLPAQGHLNSKSESRFGPMGSAQLQSCDLATLLYKLRKGRGMQPLHLNQLNTKTKGSVLPLLLPPGPHKWLQVHPPRAGCIGCRCCAITCSSEAWELVAHFRSTKVLFPAEFKV